MFNPYQLSLAWGKTVLNTYLDHVYYDVSIVTAADQDQLPPLGPEPILLCLSPGQGSKLVAHRSLAELKAVGGAPSVFALLGAVSAPLGGAALAHNLTRALGQSVCVILPSAFNSGWFPDWTSCWSSHPECRSQSEVLSEILRDPEVQASLLVGHSKGCADLAQSLKELESTGWPVGFDPAVVTLGGVVQLPERLTRVYQLLGEYDWLGYLNSRTDLSYQSIAGSGHHLNRQLPFHLNVAEVLRECAV